MAETKPKAVRLTDDLLRRIKVAAFMSEKTIGQFLQELMDRYEKAK